MNNNGDSNKALVREVLAITRTDGEESVVESSDVLLERFYVKLLEQIMSGTLDRTDPVSPTRVIMAFKADPAYEAHRDMVPELENLFKSREEMKPETYDKILTSIKNVVVFYRVKKQLGTSYQKLNKAAMASDPEMISTNLQAVKSSVEDIGNIFVEVANDVAEKAKCDSINFKRRDTVERGIVKNRARNIAGVIRTPWQGLNRALGKAGGLVAGESCFINALPHQYKTGLLSTLAFGAVVYNDLKPTVPGKIPLVYFGSLENETFQNMMWIFKKLYYKETGRAPKGLTDDQVADWLMNYFAKFGTELIIDRFMPQDFGFNEFKTKIESLEDAGYEVKLAVIDYVNLMKMGTDSKASSAGRHHDICVLVRSLCGFCKNKGITFVSAHPLNREALRLESLTTGGNVVKKFGPEHLAESMDIEREVDVSIYLHLEYNHAGVRFCTIRLNKHRYVDDTPAVHKYFAMPFMPDGVGIIDDIDGAPNYVQDIQAYGIDDAENANDNAEFKLAANSVF